MPHQMWNLTYCHVWLHVHHNGALAPILGSGPLTIAYDGFGLVLYTLLHGLLSFGLGRLFGHVVIGSGPNSS